MCAPYTGYRTWWDSLGLGHTNY